MSRGGEGGDEDEEKEKEEEEEIEVEGGEKGGDKEVRRQEDLIVCGLLSSFAPHSRHQQEDDAHQ